MAAHGADWWRGDQRFGRVVDIRRLGSKRVIAVGAETVPTNDPARQMLDACVLDADPSER